MTTRPAARSRSGITLTEILISILIMGIGLLSLATLFPLGLTRIRDAQRNSRSVYLAESVLGDVAARNLLAPARFAASPYYNTGQLPNPPYLYADPFIQDSAIDGTFPNATDPGTGFVIPKGVYRGWGLDGQPHEPARNHPAEPFLPGTGLPVAYDPLWRMETGVVPNNGAVDDGRFARGIGFLRNDPDGGAPSAHGLQRVTNFPFGDPNANAAIAAQYAVIGSTFASPDDPVFQSEGDSSQGPGFGSPVVPDLSTGRGVMLDWTFTWLFTGFRADVSNTTVYAGDIVILHARPMAFDDGPAPFAAGNVKLAAGERVVEAVFAYGTTMNPNDPGYAAGDDRTVLLRWPAFTPDPDVRVGTWIADVTYERMNATDFARFRSVQVPNQRTFHPGQRCYWYRVVSKGTAEPDPGFGNDPKTSPFRRLIVTVNSPVRAKTLMMADGSAYPLQPVHVNAALVSPYVVNVFSRVFYAR